MKHSKLKTSQLCIDAMLAAMTAVLGYIAIDMGTVKITFESLPVVFSALLFGPVDGLIVGGIGTFLYQILRYGFSLTTALWILPYIVIGVLAGLYAKKANFNNNRKQILFIAIVCELVVWFLNTGVIYVDSMIYGYYTPVYVWGAVAIRFVIALAKGILFGIIMLPLLKKLSKITGNGRSGKVSNE